MNITQSLKQSIESRFGDGSCFTTLDFPDLSKNFSIKQIGANLITLADNHYLKREEKVRLKIRNKPPVNRYRLAINVEEEAEQEVDTSKGQTTVWHPSKTTPVNPCRGRHVYEVLLYSDEITCYAWKGFWPIPLPWIKGWRGVTR